MKFTLKQILLVLYCALTLALENRLCAQPVQTLRPDFDNTLNCTSGDCQGEVLDALWIPGGKYVFIGWFSSINLNYARYYIAIADTNGAILNHRTITYSQSFDPLYLLQVGVNNKTGGYFVLSEEVNTMTGASRIWFMEFDTLLNLTWNHRYGSGEPSSGRVARQLNDGRFVLTANLTQGNILVTDSVGQVMQAVSYGDSVTWSNALMTDSTGFYIYQLTNFFDFELDHVAANGQHLWRRVYEIQSPDLYRNRSCVLAPDGSIYLVGFYQSMSSASYWPSIMKFDNNGTPVWSKTYHNNTTNPFTSMVFENIDISPDNKIYVRGREQANGFYDPTYIVWLDSAGTVLGSRQFKDPQYAGLDYFAHQMHILPNGNILLPGTGPNSYIPSYNSGSLLVTDSSGNYGCTPGAYPVTFRSNEQLVLKSEFVPPPIIGNLPPVSSTTFTTGAFPVQNPQTHCYGLYTALNVNEQAETSSLFRIWPNPAMSDITIKLPPGALYFRLYDLSGKVVYNSATTEVEFTISLKSLPQGVYIAETATAETILKTRLIRL